MNLKNNFSKIKGYVLLKNGEVYEPYLQFNQVVDVLIKDNLIIQIKKNIPAKSNYHTIDCKGCLITNGFVDLHAHFREPGFEFKETILSGSMSAFVGGYTRVCTMPNTNPVIDTPELIDHVIRASIETPVYIHPIGAITKSQKGMELAEIGKMVSSGAIAISDDGLPVENSQIMRYALEYSKKFNIPVINHAEDLCLANNGLMHEGDNSLKLGLPGNPSIAESSMIFRDVSIAEYVGGKLHVPHISSKESVAIIKKYKSMGVNVTSEITPHHLSLTDDFLLDYDTNAKVAPPIRSEEDQKALIEAIEDGTIDCIATDHAPHAIEDKERDFDSACCGMIGLESAFGLVNKTLNKSKMSFKSIVDLFTIKPSKIFNIAQNNIKEGNQAELNILNPNVTWTFKRNNIYSKSYNSPIVGQRLKGKVVGVINKGYFFNSPL